MLLTTFAQRLSDAADTRAVIEMVDVPRSSACLAVSADKRWALGVDFRTVVGYLGVLKAAEQGFTTVSRIAEAYDYIGNRHTHAERYQEAMVCLDEALALVPDYDRALVDKGYLLRRMGQTEAGLELTRRATILHPDSPIAWFAMGLYYEALGQWPEAEAALRQSLELGIKDPWAQAVLARVLVRQGRCAEALPYAQTLVDNDPNYAIGQRGLGDVYWCLGDKARAAAAYRRFVTLSPERRDEVSDRLKASE